MRRLVVVRPEPGDARTATAIRALGYDAVRMPLFAVAPVAWTPPLPDRFDALMLTSANAIRHAGLGLTRLAALPVVAVGTATAAAARAAGLNVVLTGDGDAAALTIAAHARGLVALLHLAGRDRAPSGLGVTTITVYASDPLAIEPARLRACEGTTVLLHSARAAMRFAALVDDAGADRGDIRLAALSKPVLRAAGEGWRSAAVATTPSDAALIAAALAD